jgi:hypothetical protein
MDAAARLRLTAATLALSFVATLPVPTPRQPADWNLVVFFLWGGCGLLAWSSWYRPAWARIAWFASFLVAFVGIFVAGTWLQALLLAAWAAWGLQRRARVAKEESGPDRRALAVILFAGALSAASPPAFAQGRPTGKADPASTIPKYLLGYKVVEIGSCTRIDQIPWKFRPDGRRTRLVIRDSLRLNTEVKFSEWEIHQVMDREGYVTYVFRRPVGAGRFESLVTKDAAYNRILDTPRGPKVVEVQSLRTFINRAVLTFVATDGSTVAFEPGLAGTSALNIQFAPSETGRVGPPLYLRGNFCTRPETDVDDKGDPSLSGAVGATVKGSR